MQTEDVYDRLVRERESHGALRVIQHQFERRLQRALSEPEARVLLDRLTALGPERVSDVLLDLAPDALATWLADPAAG